MLMAKKKPLRKEGATRSPKRREQIPIKKPRTLLIYRLLDNPDLLGQIEDLAATGASLATIDAVMKFPPNTMSKLLSKGKARQTKSYYQFYLLFRSWAGEARHAAESSMAKKSPDKWLDRNTSNKVLESEEDRSLALSAPSNPTTGSIPGITGDKILSALKLLRNQGISIDEAIDKDDILSIEVQGENDNGK